MHKQQRLIRVIFLILFSSIFFSCEYSEPCDERNNDTVVLRKSELILQNVIGWEVVPGGLHKITFRFSDIDLGTGGIKSYRREDVCTSIPFYSRLRYWSDLDADHWFKDRVKELKILAWYPSVPPSGKVLLGEGNKENGEAIQIRLPTASKEFHDASWVELGFELLFASDLGNGFSEDMALLKEEVLEFQFHLDYVEF